MPKRRKPTPKPRQLQSQKPKKQKQQKSTQKTRRVSTGIQEAPKPRIPKPKQNKPRPKVTKPQQPTSTPVTDMETGEVVTSMLPEVNTQVNFYSQAVITGWRLNLEHNTNGEAYNLLKNWLDDMIAQNGIDNVAEMLQQGTADGNILTWETVYKSGEAERYISTMLDYLPDQGELYKEKIQDKFEYYKQMTNAMEQNEDWEDPV